MFNEEDFINDYVEAVKNGNTEKQAEVIGRLTSEEDFAYRKELIGKIKDNLGAEEDYTQHIEFLNQQLELIDLVENSVVAADTVDVAADDNAEEVTEDNTTSDVEEVGEVTESGGYAPTTEEKEVKSEA